MVFVVVLDGVGVGVHVGVEVIVLVTVQVPVFVAVLVAVLVGVRVAVLLGVPVAVGVAVFVAVLVDVLLGVGVAGQVNPQGVNFCTRLLIYSVVYMLWELSKAIPIKPSNCPNPVPPVPYWLT